MKKIKITLLVILGIIVLVELVGRYYGLTNYPLYNSSDEFEYLLKPNQDVTIYRNRFVTNAYSMRSDAINEKDSIVVLLLGDSVLNGGNSIDQDSLASTMLEKELFHKYGKKVRVLNISDKTWSPDNTVAYLKKYGVFKADMMLLVANSGDAYDPMTFRPIVGVASTHPAQNQLFAWQNLIAKAWPVLKKTILGQSDLSKLTGNQIEKKEKFIKGFAALDSISRRLKIPFSIYLHRTQPELESNKLDPGGLAIVNFCKEQGVPIYINRFKTTYFIDEIHLNNTGQKALMKDLLPIVRHDLKL
ncbi:hypothetical protein [Larkinella knui]|uniref:SGNH/GDSL hydrolase family protein n=1 Tax=Larkinella knui TaxID=2025310 RepID=A0A3P1CDG6_9BACT|nr:hypothetical protein [Larkinella knui]RRB11250.1 hypothetical protein EHT87_22435 [Larkinella knui]